MAAYKHVIWDWNGTLIDDGHFCVDIMNKMLQKRDLPPMSLDFYKAMIEFPVVLYYEKLGFDFTTEQFEVISDEFIAHYQAGWKECSLQKGAMQAIRQLDSEGIAQSVLSACKREHLIEQIEHFGLTGFFQTVTGVDDHHGRGKVHMAEEHIASLTTPPRSVVMVGDTLHDAEVAQACGCDCILVSFGHYNVQRLAASGKRVAEDMLKVIDYIAG